jgi:hypothetical protein
MYAMQSHQRDTTSDLAAGLTDLALEAIAGTSVPRDSVETELRLWHTLEAELERDHRWQRSNTGRGEAVPAGQDLRQVVCRAARQVAGAMK